MHNGSAFNISVFSSKGTVHRTTCKTRPTELQPGTCLTLFIDDKLTHDEIINIIFPLEDATSREGQFHMGVLRF